jgi:hypothetical protein
LSEEPNNLQLVLWLACKIAVLAFLLTQAVGDAHFVYQNF